MEVASNVSCNTCSDSKESGSSLDERPSYRDQASQTTGTERSSGEVKDEGMPSAVSIRVTKRGGGVRLSLSNMKVVRGSDNTERISFVRSPNATHLTKAQFKAFRKLGPELTAALNAVEISQQMKGKSKRTQRIEPFYKYKPQGNVISSKLTARVPLKLKIPTKAPCDGESDIHLYKTKSPTPSSPLPDQPKIHPQPHQSVLLDQDLPLKKRGRPLPSTSKMPLKRKQPPITAETLSPLTHQPLKKNFIIPVDK